MRPNWLSNATFWLAGAATVALVLSYWAIGEYGASAYWPGMVGNFAASLAAFSVALAWENQRERTRQLRDNESLEESQQREAARLQQLRATEVRRRLKGVSKELAMNQESLEQLAGFFGNVGGRVMHPQLLDLAWAANSARLSELIADYDLTADLAITYGRTEELRWRLRQRTATVSVAAGSPVAGSLILALDGMTRPLVGELLTEVTGLIERIESQMENPDVQPLGLVHVRAGGGTSQATGGGSGGQIVETDSVADSVADSGDLT